jgi:hypothetical protein
MDDLGAVDQDVGLVVGVDRIGDLRVRPRGGDVETDAEIDALIEPDEGAGVLVEPGIRAGDVAPRVSGEQVGGVPGDTAVLRIVGVGLDRASGAVGAEDRERLPGGLDGSGQGQDERERGEFQRRFHHGWAGGKGKRTRLPDGADRMRDRRVSIATSTSMLG